MNRRQFISKGCTACLPLMGFAAAMQSCTGTKYITGKLNNDGLIVPLTEFNVGTGANTAYRSFIIVRNEALQFPVCVFRNSATEYNALWMKCTHQGAELQASGDFLQCPAHGSEFNKKGEVSGGPAENNLKSFPVTVNKNELFIDLRKK